MDIQAEKLNLMKWLSDVNEVSVIQQFIILKNTQQTDWWEVISEDEKIEIETGLAEADKGEVLAHEEVMSKYQKYDKRNGIKNGTT